MSEVAERFEAPVVGPLVEPCDPNTKKPIFIVNYPNSRETPGRAICLPDNTPNGTKVFVASYDRKLSPTFRVFSLSYPQESNRKFPSQMFLREITDSSEMLLKIFRQEVSVSALISGNKDKRGIHALTPGGSFNNCYENPFQLVPFSPKAPQVFIALLTPQEAKRYQTELAKKTI